jgi:translocation and assembly module TamA
VVGALVLAAAISLAKKSRDAEPTLPGTTRAALRRRTARRTTRRAGQGRQHALAMKSLAVFLMGCILSTAAFGQGQDPRTDDNPQDEDDPHAEESAQSPAREQRLAPLTVTWQAPEPLRKLFEQHLPPPNVEGGERRAGALRPWIRDVRRRVPEIAASEGYFSATVELEFEGERREHVTITVTPGPRTTVETVEITFQGDIAGEGEAREKRRQELRDAFAMKRGQPFRSPDWDVAKTRLVEALTEIDYAAGQLAASRGEVDAEAAKAHLKLVLDSGPPFTIGDVVILGLQRYPEAVVRRLLDLQRGERFNYERLTELQRMVQNGPWFSSVVADIERDPMKPDLVPVKLTVTERPRREIGVALGYGTDDGARAEAALRERNLFNRGLDLQSSFRVSQKRQIGYADVYLPPGYWRIPRFGPLPFKDSVGVLAEYSDIENLKLSRLAFAGYRHFMLEKVETRVGLSYQIERFRPADAEMHIKRALAPVVQFTWRHVDNVFDPRRGGVLNLQVAAGSKRLASGDDFLKLYAQYQYWIPITPDDQILLRTELGRTHTSGPERIPEDFLFRAGGSRSNRGYSYQSLGVREGNAIVGGRYLATGTAEYVHWLNATWGAALFTDVGSASNSPRDWEALKSYGIGARYRTPAGPFALDLAYAERDRKFRLAFSVTVAF